MYEMNALQEDSFKNNGWSLKLHIGRSNNVSRIKSNECFFQMRDKEMCIIKITVYAYEKIHR